MSRYKEQLKFTITELNARIRELTDVKHQLMNGVVDIEKIVDVIECLDIMRSDINDITKSHEIVLKH